MKTLLEELRRDDGQATAGFSVIDEIAAKRKRTTLGL